MPIIEIPENPGRLLSLKLTSNLALNLALNPALNPAAGGEG
ncbi:hypothetical protein [Lyngbya confervoides]|nr:hypothetical protein [Lyngbya confervoides]